MAIKLYWMRGKGRDNPEQRNFGDYLSKDIVEMVSGKEVVWAPAKNADLLAIGTILNRLMKAQGKLFTKRVNVWGTGSGEKAFPYSPKHFYHAVRGPLTAEKLPGSITVSHFGDPGILSSELREGKTPPLKKYRIGLIPHYVDQDSPTIQRITNEFPRSTVISVFDSIHNIMEEILKCDFILSSSMHGLIVSDSLGVPNIWLKLSDSFEEFKFNDYYASHGLETASIRAPFDIKESAIEESIESYSRPRLDDLKQSIWTAFPSNLS